MKMNSLIFIICFVIALGGGYFLFDNGGNDTATSVDQESEQAADEEAEADEEADTDEEEEEDTDNTIPAEAEPLARNNCLSCHAVDSLDADGGNTGPDLSNAADEIEDKRSIELDEFLQEPNSATMAGVIEDNPLDDDEREAIVEALEEAAEAND